MTERPYEPVQHPQPAPGATYGGPPPPLPTAYGYYPPAMGPGQVPVGKIRSTGICILLTVVTLGIYPLVYFYLVHDEMKRHSGNGIGGGIALLLAFFVGIAMPFITSSEVGQLHEARGMRPPVSGVTGL
jgi:hypothetical protein